MDAKRITKTTKFLIRSYVESITKDPDVFGDEFARGFRHAVAYAVIADTGCTNAEAFAYVDEQLAKAEA